MGSSESRDSSFSGSDNSPLTRRSLPSQSNVDPFDVDVISIRNKTRSVSTLRERKIVATNRSYVPRPRPSRRYPSSSSSSSNDEIQRERGGIEKGQEVIEETSSQLSYWYLIKHGYTELVHLIIRPPRTDYELEDLGPMAFSFAGQAFIREDFVVVNDRKQKLVCSHWRPATPSMTQMMPCVVYLHGNSSCRLEALGVLRTCLAAGITVAAFDTAGCGKSDGEYISLGYYERDDLSDVVTHLRTKMNIGTVALWGRSMGAATALLHADRDPSIAGIVVDSAFASLEQLVEEVVDRGRQEGMTLPGFLVKIVLKFVRSSVKKRAHFDLRRLSPIDHAAMSFVPVLFVAAEHDSFIAPHHSDQIFAAYGGDKNLVKVDGDHNSSRPQFLLDSAAIFLQTALQVDTAATAQMSNFADDIVGGGECVPWEGVIDRTLSMSMCSSSTSSYQPWSRSSCVLFNRTLSMHFETCKHIYLADESKDDDNAFFDKAQRSALQPKECGVHVPAKIREAPRGQTWETVLSLLPSFVSSTSAQLRATS